MLTSLSIQNVILIDQLNIEFRAGLCALTGETGAGKSIIISAGFSRKHRQAGTEGNIQIINDGKITDGKFLKHDHPNRMNGRKAVCNTFPKEISIGNFMSYYGKIVKLPHCKKARQKCFTNEKL
jgi:ABC-type multidrug transport system ATPase subunit